MRPAKVVKRGEEFLKGVSEEELRLMQAKEKNYRPKSCCRRPGTGRRASF